MDVVMHLVSAVMDITWCIYEQLLPKQATLFRATGRPKLLQMHLLVLQCDLHEYLMAFKRD